MKKVLVTGKPLALATQRPCEFCGEPMYNPQSRKKVHASCRRKMNNLRIRAWKEKNNATKV